MIVFVCQVCQTPLSAETGQAGQLVRCPTCLTTLQVPDQAPVGEPAGTTAAVTGPTPPPRPPANPLITGRTGGKRYGFNCGYCSSRLEGSSAMAAQEGQCPTCGNTITIPILDRYNRLIDPKTREIIKQDPHPVHAYAAAGERAPVIFRGPEGRHFIRCPRCSAVNPITANNCKDCALPFTMEGTTLEAAGGSNGMCVAALTLGIIGLIPCIPISGLLALILGGIGYSQVTKAGNGGRGKGMAVAGMVLGAIGVLISLLVWLR